MKRNEDVILKIILFMAILFFNGLIIYYSLDFKLIGICIVFSILIIIIFLIYEMLFKKYISSSLEDLSNMLDVIINFKDEETFSVVEESLFSKLQVQSIKLSKILKSQNKTLEKERDEIKSLISDIAHQLKTPLTNIKMYSEFLQDSTLNEEERKEFNNVVLRSLDKLSFLVESMIKMSRLESGVINLRRDKGSINETVLLAISEVQKKAKMKNINITLNEIDRKDILHDKNWTVEAIVNILENAIKYTKNNGKINITLQSYEVFFRIDIEDNGIGIKEEEIPKIFTRFYRGNNVGNEEGIGIGLYLTREIINKQGGYIKVSSSKDGNIFYFFIYI